MATNSEARKARERRLRAKYRKKTITTSIITFIVGLVLGFVLCAVAVSHPGPISRMLGVGPTDVTQSEPEALEGEDADFGEDDIVNMTGEDLEAFGEGDILEAAKYTVLAAISSDEESRTDVLSSCLLPRFAP